MKTYSSDRKIQKSLRYSMYDGIFASAMTGFTQEYLAPFLIAINATVRQIGLLTAVPNLVAAVLQLRSAEMTERLGSRKRTVNLFVLLQACMLIPMAVVALTGGNHVTAFIAAVTLFTAFGAFATPAWGSMMADLVPEDRRGDFFGWRTMLLGFTTIAATYAAGFIIHRTAPVGVTLGFAVVFGLAFLFRLGSWTFLRKMYEPPPPSGHVPALTFRSFLTGLRGDAFGRFVLSVALMNFSVNLAGPFFAVLMLRDLGFSYLLYSSIIVTAALTVYLTIRRWGLHADRVGNIRVIRSTSRIICILPLLWIIGQHPLYLFAVQVLAGVVWAGFNLSASTFIYDAVPSRNRTRNIAYFNAINGLAIFAGAALGGVLVDWLPLLLGNPIFSLFLLSSALRIMVFVGFVAKLRDVRPVPRVRSMDLFFSIIGIRPLIGVDRKTLRY